MWVRGSPAAWLPKRTRSRLVGIPNQSPNPEETSVSPEGRLVSMSRGVLVVLPLPFFLAAAVSCRPDSESAPGQAAEVPTEELSAQVPELDAVHEVMRPMWHDAFPARDFDAIRASVAEFEPLLEALDQVSLPGILRDKEARWDDGKTRLLESFRELRTAAAAEDEEGMLGAAEAFHMNYEAMVRIIRPVVPELETFHQHLYGVYHYYGPAYDLEKLRRGAEEMGAAIPPLLAAQLPSRLADRQAEFEAAVAELGDQVAGLLMILEDPTREEVDAAIEAVHAAYQEVEAIFGG